MGRHDEGLAGAAGAPKGQKAWGRINIVELPCAVNSEAVPAVWSPSALRTLHSQSRFWTPLTVAGVAI